MAELAHDAIERFKYSFVQVAAERLRLLLETKHLYQKLSLDFDEVIKQLLSSVFASEHGDGFRFGDVCCQRQAGVCRTGT